MQIEGRSIFGYFSDRNDAESAKEQLRKAGFEDTQLDAVRHDGAVGSATRPISGEISSLSDLTMGADSEGDDTGILLSADPAASGLARGDLGEGAKAWLVVTVTDGSDQEVERAVKILKSHGGDV